MGKSINRTFNHLKIHTQYSICEGAIQIEKLKDYCKEHKIKSIGLSDTSNLFGALEFSEKISKSGTQPIIGTQIYFEYNSNIGSLPLIAKNEEGYKRIMELSSKSFIENKNISEPHCKLSELFNLSHGIIILSGGMNGLIGKLFNKGKTEDIEKIYNILNKNYKNNFYIEIQRHGDQSEKSFENFNLNISNKYQIPIIASHEVYYLEKSSYEAHDALMCIGSKTYINDVNRVKLTSEHYLKSNEEMVKIFTDLPEALENNYNLPTKCSFRPLTSKPILPNISSDKDGNAENLLLKESNDGLIQKFIKIFKIDKNTLPNHPNFKKYKKRLDHEIEIINKMNYASYFLIVSDYIKWAKSKNIPVGPGRGSGAGSLVAWCLSITDVDPIKFNLIFERFLNPDRISMPDFDIDFCEEKRDKVFSYLKQKYGKGVAHIITFGKLKARMALRDIGRVLGLPYGYVDALCKMIPFDPSRPLSLEQAVAQEPRIRREENKDPRVKKLIEISKKLEGLNRNMATHAAGVVIPEENLSTFVPLYKDPASKSLLPSTQFDMYSSENAGLVKFDLLGLKTLTVISKTISLLREKNIKLDITKIKLDDQKIFEQLSSGNTVGLFQLESAGMRDALVNMKPNMFEDIIALVALYRPGPMGNIAIYNQCKHGKKEPDYLHPKLKEILEPTYGVIIYQEQVMQIAQILSGFSAGEADILRRAMGKKKRAELEKQKERFVNGAVKNGISKDTAIFIFKKIEPFAEYGFNKSHAAAYAMIAYQTAFLKNYYPNEFIAASMSNEMSNTDKLSEFFEEAKRLGIKVYRPCINQCFAEFIPKDNSLLYALGAIKNVGFDAISQVINEREKNGKFKSVSDFINRVDPKSINKLQLEGLTKAGAFDSIFKNRKVFYDNIPNIIQNSKNIHENKTNNQSSLFSEESHKISYLITDKDSASWKNDETLSKEFESVGFYLSNHPLKNYEKMLEQHKVKTFKEFENTNESQSVLAGTIMSIKEKKTLKGNNFAIVKFSDLSKVFELFLFSEILEMNRKNLVEGQSFLLTVIKDKENQENRFRRISVRKIISLNEIVKMGYSNVHIEIDDTGSLAKLYESIKEKGNSKIKISFSKNNKNYLFELKDKRKFNNETLKYLNNEHFIKKISV